ncbi:MAG: response regulator transcription factor [Desulfobacterota bacterium]|nr:response regulator transcription factor [Thermodesulfobacteriota bacterium]
MNELIAIIEDEPDIRELLSLNFQKAGFRVESFERGDRFLKFLLQKLPDLIILDLMLPDTDGLEICKYLKRKDEFSAIPIIMVTARSEEIDKILGLELGADDYVTKPFSIKELVARARVILRRRSKTESTKVIEIGQILTINLDKFEVKVEGKKIELTSTEFKLLELLASKPGWVFTRDKILDYLWGDEKLVLDRTVDVHVKNLRAKLGEAKDLIKNVRGIGYKIEE